MSATIESVDVGAELVERLSGPGLTVLAGDVGELVEGVTALAALAGRRVLLVLPAAAATVAAASIRRLETWLPEGADDQARDLIRVARDPGDHDRGGRDLVPWVRALADDHSAELVLLAVIPALSVEAIAAEAPEGTVLVATEWPRDTVPRAWAQNALRSADQLRDYSVAYSAAVRGDLDVRLIRASIADITYSDYVTIQRGDSEDQTFGSGGRRIRVNLSDDAGEPPAPIEIRVARTEAGEESRRLEPLRDYQRAGRHDWKPGDAGAPEGLEVAP